MYIVNNTGTLREDAEMHPFLFGRVACGWRDPYFACRPDPQEIFFAFCDRQRKNANPEIVRQLEQFSDYFSAWIPNICTKKIFLKNFKKSVDRHPGIWYYNYRNKENTTHREVTKMKRFSVKIFDGYETRFYTTEDISKVAAENKIAKYHKAFGHKIVTINTMEIKG